MADHLLDGLRVLDFSRVLAGPFATRMLSDMGADVVKIEPPEGDVTRRIGRKRHGVSGYFQQHNAGKRDISLDLNQPEARDLARALVAEADLVVENFRPGVMARFGLAWDDLRPIKPDLVMLSISGFGQEGPERDRASYASVIHAESGLLERHAWVDGRMPSDLPISLADTLSGAHGLVAALAALPYAKRTGIGQHIDMSMIHTMMAADDYAHLVLDGYHVTGPGGRIFDATGGPILVNGDDREFWSACSRRGGLADPSTEDDEPETRFRLRREAVKEWFRSFDSREELTKALDACKLVWGNVRDHQTVYDEQPSVAALGIVAEVDDRGGGTRRVMQSPYNFSAAVSGVRGPAPYIGEHNGEVLRDWLGMSGDEVARLSSTGALVQRLPGGDD